MLGVPRGQLSQIWLARIWLAAALTATTLPSGCGDDGGGDGGSSTTAGSSSSGDDTTTTTTSTTTTSSTSTSGTGDTGMGSTTGDPIKPELGDTPNPMCDDAMAELAIIVAENATGMADPVVVSEAYLGMDGNGTALQQFVREYGAELGRVTAGSLDDDTAILASLAAATPAAMIDVETRVLLLITKVVEGRGVRLGSTPTDPDRDPALVYALWDDAYCYFDAALRGHAMEADAEGIEVEGIEPDIQTGFEQAHDGIESAADPAAIDPWLVLPAAAQIDHAILRQYDRLVIKYATQAMVGLDPLAQRRALGYFRIVRDQLVGLNTPGIVAIEGALTGDPALIDPANIRLRLEIGWAKRTRRTTDGAIVDGTVGMPQGLATAVQGRTYAKISIPFMTMVPNFDAAAYLSLWDDYAQGAEAGDFGAVMAASEQLTQIVCDYQAVLGIAACTSSLDEP